ncbi:protein of unknown function [Taphrina deformans PYCC 5710]|uniref:RNase MRP protein 1 RNA binding domain-containing protein n=1 Tax=Taphrina deformans (strain PYCC 5710 / ATCC 11124 / CBS 356.35 / IMI 108563 / JCM 9778 / NBRC 8474) TaxID=1097556 RepID=R4X6I3_TAPDE|nr:protein of unknown function [Taphrina deformans PYCC 5710]|eukprot:CCG80744.1 protein of unknown function [Taphrina deformans PYCC 5710]
MQYDDSKTVAHLDDSALAVLRSELDIVQLLHHHNKNQHRGATWYKYVKLLKSCLNRILTVAVVRQASSRETTKRQKSAEQARSKALYEDEIHGFLLRYQNIYIGFTQIIGTGQYVALGMVLLGVLARCWQIIRSLITAQEIDDEAAVELKDIEDARNDDGDNDGLDEGIVVQRSISVIESSQRAENLLAKASDTRVDSSKRTNMDSMAAPVANSSGTSSPRQTASAAKKRKKKKVKNADEIDSIFG